MSGSTPAAHAHPILQTLMIMTAGTQCESKKYPIPPKKKQYYHLRPSMFLWNFASLLPIYIHTYWPILVDLSQYFLEVLIVFNISSFKFTKSNCREFIANDEWPPIHPTSIHWIIRFGAMMESYHKLELKPNTVPEFEDALQLRENHWQRC